MSARGPASVAAVVGVWYTTVMNTDKVEVTDTHVIIPRSLLPDVQAGTWWPPLRLSVDLGELREVRAGGWSFEEATGKYADADSTVPDWDDTLAHVAVRVFLDEEEKA